MIPKHEISFVNLLYDGVQLPLYTATGRDALEGKGPQSRPQRRLGRRLEEVAKAVGGGYCWLQMPLKLALAVRETMAGHRLGTPPPPPTFQCTPGDGWGASWGDNLVGKFRLQGR